MPTLWNQVGTGLLETAAFLTGANHYLGFIHSAFTLKAEARLDSTRFREMIIRRGELVDLLAKALLYTQVEAHYKQVGILPLDIPRGNGLRAWVKSSLVTE
jgi:hypothetical protein